MGVPVTFRWWQITVDRRRGRHQPIGRCWQRREVLAAVVLWGLLVRLELRELRDWLARRGRRGLR